MIISSHLHPNSTSQEFIPVTICTYNGESKFIRVRDDYEEFMDTVKVAFSLWSDPKLQIQTSSLDICQGRNITVDNSAFPYIWKALDEVIVSIVGNERKPILFEQDVFEPAAVQEVIEHTAAGPLPSLVQEPPLEKEHVDSRLPMPTAAHDIPVKARMRSKKTAEDKKKALEEEVPVKKEKASTKKAPKDGASTTRKRGPAKGQNKNATASSSAPFEEGVEEPAPPIPAFEENPDETNTNISPKSEQELEVNGRVQITVVGPDGGCVTYTARPKHTIKKILMAACRSYEIDYQVARLELVREDDNGVMLGPFHICKHDDVIGHLEIDEHTRLILRTEGDEEELYEDDPLEEEEQEQPHVQDADEAAEGEDDAISRTRQYFNRQK